MKYVIFLALLIFTAPARSQTLLERVSKICKSVFLIEYFENQRSENAANSVSSGAEKARSLGQLSAAQRIFDLNVKKTPLEKPVNRLVELEDLIAASTTEKAKEVYQAESKAILNAIETGFYSREIILSFQRMYQNLQQVINILKARNSPGDENQIRYISTLQDMVTGWMSVTGHVYLGRRGRGIFYEPRMVFTEGRWIDFANVDWESLPQEIKLIYLSAGQVLQTDADINAINNILNAGGLSPVPAENAGLLRPH
jgi:hypothetical protein